MHHTARMLAIALSALSLGACQDEPPLDDVREHAAALQGASCAANADCNDQNPCTTDKCAAGACGHTPKVNGTACTGADRCMHGDTCQAGVCADGVVPIMCVAKDDCHVVGQCVPATGKCTNPPAPLGTACDDESLCTRVDACNANGRCVGSDKVTCPAATACRTHACAPATGQCVPSDRPDGSPCDDGSTCTTDRCAAGACLATAKRDGTGCDDQDACTCGDGCAAGACAGGAPVACDDGDACTIDGCDPAVGCTYAATVGACDDSDACTQGDSCATGECRGVSIACDDGDACTADGCDPALGCTHDAVACCGDALVAVDEECDDGNPFAGDGCGATCGWEGCGDGALALGEGCDDDNRSDDDGCDAACVAEVCGNGKVQSGEHCDDGNALLGDGCRPDCAIEVPPVCGQPCCPFAVEGLPPTDGGLTCDDPSVLACVCGAMPECCESWTEECALQGEALGCLACEASCDDNLRCTVDSCGPDGCENKSVCDDGNDCTIDSCDEANLGCEHKLRQGACDDGLACTEGDTCMKVHGEAVCLGSSICGDHDACTTDACDAELGTCTNIAVSCADDDQCTSDFCDPELGCVYAVHNGACDDGDPCTAFERCTLIEIGVATCANAAPKCDDGNDCTSDSCEPTTGACTNAFCDDGEPCTSDSCRCEGDGSCACEFAASSQPKECGGSCVGLNDTDFGCAGPSCAACSAPPNATATCGGAGGTCAFVCHGGYKRCGNACVATSDPTFGCSEPGCSPCQAAPTHGTRVCGGEAPFEVCDVACDYPRKYCGGACVNTSADVNGCSFSGCAPCDLPHATAHDCASLQCRVEECELGWEDRDENPSNGCEYRNPESIAGAYLWYDASTSPFVSLANLAEHGALDTYYLRHEQGGATSVSPTLVDGVDGIQDRCLRFAPGGYPQQKALWADGPSFAAGSFTIVALVARDTNAGNNYFFSQGQVYDFAGGGCNDGNGCVFGGPILGFKSATELTWFNGYRHLPIAVPSVAPGELQVYRIIARYQDGVGHYMSVNGVEVALGQPARDGVGALDLFIGGPYGQSNSYPTAAATPRFDGYVCEVVVYRRALATGEVQVLDEYLHHKWQ